MKLWLTIAVLLTGVCSIRSDDKREEKPRFKGVELYSWKDQAGAWVFVLVDGTNARKKEGDVKASKVQIQGVEELKKALTSLAVGEYVSWAHESNGFEHPSKATQKEIKKTAEEAKLNFTIAEHYNDRSPSKDLVWYKLDDRDVKYFILADGKVYPGRAQDGKYIVWHRAEPLLATEYPYGGPQSRMPLIEAQKIDYQTEPVPEGLKRITKAK